MRVLALDPSLVKTGWALYGLAEGQAAWLVASGVVRPRTDRDDAWRLTALVAQLDDAVTPHIDPVRGVVHVVIEQAPAFTYARAQRMGKTLNGGALRKLNMAAGALVGWAAGITPFVHLVEATTWKGQAPKWVTQAVTGTRSSDEADAIALGSWWVRVGHTLAQERLRCPTPTPRSSSACPTRRAPTPRRGARRLRRC